eukprot:gb/GECG01013394.1/.p1 GENE.gb/GECG01013394.1/~~gb/GECG01013394.1/.p1  ORF type:complete len:194 (+),score=33.38 gb/GECG01013394.1/:1-582(+)
MSRSVTVVRQNAPTGSLSDRFAKITQEAKRPNAPGKQQRAAAQTAQINIRRGSKIAEKRFGKGVSASGVKAGNNQGRRGGRNRRGGGAAGGGRGRGGNQTSRVGVKNMKSVGAGRGRGSAKAARGGAKRAQGGRGQSAKQGKGLFSGPQPSSEQLDFEMDKYMHSGGKAANPDAAQLDKEVESYFAKSAGLKA